MAKGCISPYTFSLLLPTSADGGNVFNLIISVYSFVNLRNEKVKTVKGVNSFQSYGASPATWDHTVLHLPSDTSERAMLRLNSRQAGQKDGRPS